MPCVPPPELNTGAEALRKKLLKEEFSLRGKQPRAWTKMKYRMRSYYLEEKLDLFKKEGIKRRDLTREEVKRIGRKARKRAENDG